MPSSINNTIHNTVEENEVPAILLKEINNKTLKKWLFTVVISGYLEIIYPTFFVANITINTSLTFIQTCLIIYYLLYITDHNVNVFLTDLNNILYQRNVRLRFAYAYLKLKVKTGKAF